MIVGAIGLAIGVFGSLAGAGGAEGASAIGGVFLAIGSGLIATGFFRRLFHLIELRLIDIQEDQRR